MAQASKNTLTVDVSINTLLDDKPVELDFIRQAVREKIERDASKNTGTVELKFDGNMEQLVSALHGVITKPFVGI